MKFTKAFYGCKKGAIYPTRFAAGDECPSELVKAARSAGAVGAAKTKADEKAGENGNPDA